jgi:hypothetical protein
MVAQPDDSPSGCRIWNGEEEEEESGAWEGLDGL